MITIQQEEYPAFVEEAKPLFPSHWKELALDQEHVPLDPDYDEYLRRYRAGIMLILTAREDAALVGYFVNFVCPGLHYRTCLTLTTDIYWVKPDARGASIGLACIEELKRVAKARGVQRIFAGCKDHFSAAWMWERAGAKRIETYYEIWLGE